MRRPNEITRREMWFATAVYRWTQLRAWSRMFAYRHNLGNCPGCGRRQGWGHKMDCGVGR
jgi:hypothetical protein